MTPDTAHSTPLPPADLANAVTSFATIGAGGITLALGWLVPPRQPARWLLVWLALFLTGLPTLGWHGWGGEPWRVADVGTNLLLAWLLMLAVLGDDWPARTRLRLGAAMGAANLAAIAWMVREAVTGQRAYLIPLGDHGGFLPGEAVLILDALVVTGLLVARRRSFPDAARPLLWLVTGLFLLGLALATADGSVVSGRVGSWHALWHVVSGLGFVVLWAFVHVRQLEGRPRTRAARDGP